MRTPTMRAPTMRAPSRAGGPCADLLLACVRAADPAVPDERVRALAGAADPPWAGLVEQAHAHRVLPAVHLQLRSLPGVPEPVRGALAEGHARQVARHLRILADLAALRPLLDGVVGTPWAVLKGPVLAELAYPRPDLRAYADLDVLVPPAAMAETVRAVEAGGGHVVDRNWTLLRGTNRGELNLRLPGGSMLDLHWHLLVTPEERAAFALPTEEVLGRAGPVALGAGPRPLTVPALDPADTVVYLALHAMLAGGHRLGWLADLRWVAAMPGLHWDDVVDRARRARAAAAVALLLERAALALGAPVPPAALDRLAPRLGWRLAGRALLAARPPGAPDRGLLSGRTVVRSSRATAAASLRELGRRTVADFAGPLARGRSPWAPRSVPGTPGYRDPLHLVRGEPADREAWFADLARPRDTPGPGPRPAPPA